MAKLGILLVILLVGLNQMESVVTETCPELKPIIFQNLLLGQGTWYDGPYTPSKKIPEGISCGRVTMEITGEDNLVDFYYVANVGEKFITINNTFEINLDGTMAFSYIEDDGTPVETIEHIRGFSPDEYYSVYSCKETGEGIEKSGYVMFRERNPSKELVVEALDYLEREGINTDLFIETPQWDSCSYAPNTVVKKIAEP